MDKSLRATTIIPENLYVEREADRQLDTIINHMGRPGYVLVARQMGKTNLLIHMKRRREFAGDIVVYVDLSNRFDSARALFRHVIDTLVESAAEKFSKAEEAIRSQRASADTEPNIEYDRHLRMLLREVEGRKVIIIFDEIDSLTSVSYSDLIFAQIRSMYFSRVNHREYDRLTYVLSGVAEPTDLIKDKNISPFNIGEKIYLEDFSHSELVELLNKANLKLSNEVADEVYGWTGGNPRMCWDVCSQLEDILIAGRPVSKKDVSFVIEKLYLTRFDQAPIDHIRVLAESDAQIRNAIMSIRWGKEDTLDEKIKNRLYLSGISRSLPGERPKIKNRVIEAALSDAWLNQIALSNKSRLDVANEHFDAGRYQEAIKLIEEYLQLSPKDQPLPLISQFHLGIANYFIGNYDAAGKELRIALDGDLNEEARATCKFYLASTLLRDGSVAESIQYFRDASEYSGPLRNSARLALGSALLTLDFDGNFSEIVEINERIISDLSDVQRDHVVTDGAEVVAAANYNIAQAHELKKAPELADEYFRRAFAVAPPSLRPAILLRGNSTTSNTRSEALTESVRIIIEGRLRLALGSKSALDLNEGVLASTFLQLAVYNEMKGFEALLLYAQHEMYGGLAPFSILLKLYRIQERNRSVWIRLVSIAVAKYADAHTNPDEKFDAYRQLALYLDSTRRERALEAYFNLLEERLRLSLPTAEEDFAILLNYGNRLVNGREFRRAARVLKTSHLVAQSTPTTEPFYSAVLWYQEFMVRSSLHEIDEARAAAETLLNKLDEAKLEKDNAYADTVSVFSKAATEFLMNSAFRNPLPKIGRNERIAVKNTKTGEVFNAKYKKVEEGLRLGNYTLVERFVGDRS